MPTFQAQIQNLFEPIYGDERVTDGDMELPGTAPNWTPGNDATLSKETTTPKEGSRCLRVTANGVTFSAYAVQFGVVTAGKYYRVRGWGRGDGTMRPRFSSGGATTHWAGIVGSSAWEYFDVTIKAEGNSFLLITIGNTGYAEFDAVSVVEVLNDSEPDSDYLINADRVRVISSHPATTPIEADLIQSESPVFDSVVVTVLSSTSIRVTFPAPALNNSALVQPGNYVITPTLAVYSVTPEAIANPNYVDLEIDEQTTGLSYEVEVQGVEKA